MDNETHRNIVKWLLANSVLYQEDGNFYSEKYTLNTPKGNAFHLALPDQVQEIHVFTVKMWELW